MNFDTYIKHALTTLNPALSHDDVIYNCAFGIIGEAGEVTDFLKKQLFHGMRPLAEIVFDTMVRAKIKDELGDLCWYIAVLSHTFARPQGHIDQDSVAFFLEEEILLLSSRVGDLSESVRASKFDDQEDHDEAYKEETVHALHNHLGELLGSVVDLSSFFGLSLDDILTYNVEKLKARHPEGFTSQYTSDSTPQ